MVLKQDLFSGIPNASSRLARTSQSRAEQTTPKKITVSGSSLRNTSPTKLSNSLRKEPDKEAMSSLSTSFEEKHMDTTVEATEAHLGLPAKAEENEEGAVILDPKNTERQYWTDPVTRIQREVWRPGDGDGEMTADYFDKPGPPPALEKRWRFYQSNTGASPIERDINEPPKYVVLDDRAAYECFVSNIPRQYLKDYWPHDFAGSGTIRTRRPHRGRGSIGDPDAEGEDKYHYAKVGKNIKYFYTGEKDYKPIVYRISDPQLAATAFRPAKRRYVASPPPKKEYGPNRHGHNQFTPKDQLVKNGAPHKGTTWLRYRDRINAFLPRDKGPPRDGKMGKSVLYSNDPGQSLLSSSVAGHQGPPLGTPAPGEEEQSLAEDMWKEASERLSKRQRIGTVVAPHELGTGDEDSNGGSDAVERGHGLAEPKSQQPFGEDADDEEPEITYPTRHKVMDPPDFFAQMLGNQSSSQEGKGVETVAQLGTPRNSELGGETYIAKLEAELKEAKEIIKQQRERIGELEKICGRDEE